MRNQPEIENLFQQFIGHYAGQMVDYYGYAGECFSLPKRWYDVLRNGHLNGPMSAPPSSNGWGSGWWSNVPEQVRELFNPEPYNPNATYPAGSLFVNTATHHIGTLVNNNPGQPTATVFHQNANPDGSPAHTSQRLKSHIDGVLVIRIAQSAPVAPTHACSYSPEPAGMKAMLTSKAPTNWYNLNPITTDPAQVPVTTTLPVDTPFTVGGYATHIDGHIYAMQPADYQRAVAGDYSTNNGIEQNDLKPVPLPPPVYIPPAAPVKATLAEKLPLVTSVVYFPTAEDAKARSTKALGAIPDGSYYVVGRDEQAVKLSKDNKIDIGWINSYDNKVEEPKPEPVIPTLPVDPPPAPVSEPVDIVTVSEPVQAAIPLQPIQVSYDWINADHSPVLCLQKNKEAETFPDLEHPDTAPHIQLNPGNKNDYSMKAFANGLEYWIPQKSLSAGYRHGVPRTMLIPILAPKKPSFFDSNKDGKVTIEDVVDWTEKLVDYASKRSYAVVSRGKQVIDGYKSKSNKRKVQ